MKIQSKEQETAPGRIGFRGYESKDVTEARALELAREWGIKYNPANPGSLEKSTEIIKGKLMDLLASCPDAVDMLAAMRLSESLTSYALEGRLPSE